MDTLEADAPYQSMEMPGPLEERPVRQSPKTYRFRLNSGMPLVVVEHHRRPVVSVRVLFGRGASSDPEGKWGMTFLAVALLGDYYEEDGSGRRLFAEASFREKVSRVGGAYRYFVHSDESGIGIDGYAKDAHRYLKMLAQALRVPRHGNRMFSARRTGVIHSVEEIEFGDDEAFFKFIGQAAFGTEHRYTRSVYGTIPSLSRMHFEEVVEHQEKILQPKDATLVVVGDVRAQAVLKAAEKYLGPWHAKKRFRTQPTISAPRIRTKRPPLLLPRKPAASMAVCGARPLSDVKKNAQAIAEVMTAVFGRGADGRLGQLLRSKHGISYYAHASLIEKRHARSMMACTRVYPKKTAEAVRLFLAAMDSMRQNPPTPAELERAKGVLAADIETEHENVGRSMSTWLKAVEFNNPTPQEERLSAIQKVSAQEVQDMARRILTRASIQLVLSGDPKYAKHGLKANGLGSPKTVRLSE